MDREELTRLVRERSRFPDLQNSVSVEPMKAVDPPNAAGRAAREEYGYDEHLAWEFLQKILDGDEAALAKMAPVVYRNISRAIGRGLARDTVSDICQDVMVKMMENLLELQREGCVLPWLIKVAKNRKIDLFRRHRPSENVDALGVREHKGLAVEPIDPVTVDRTRILEEVLLALPEDMRRLLLTAYVKDNSVRKIAEAIGLSPSTIQRRLEVARDTARQLLKKRGVDSWI